MQLLLDAKEVGRIDMQAREHASFQVNHQLSKTAILLLEFFKLMTVLICTISRPCTCGKLIASISPVGVMSAIDFP
jgi:hypothetical protein